MAISLKSRNSLGTTIRDGPRIVCRARPDSGPVLQSPDKDVETPLHAGRHADRAAHAREPTDHPEHGGDLRGHLVESPHDDADPGQLIVGVMGKLAELVGERLDLTRHRTDLALDLKENALGAQRRL